MDLSFFTNAAQDMGIVRTAKETIFMGDMPNQPASKFNRPHMLEFMASTGFVPGDVHQIGKDAWKIVHIPAERMQTDRLMEMVRDMATEVLELPATTTDNELIDMLLVGYNDCFGDWHWGVDLMGNSIKRRTNDDSLKARWLAEALFTAMGCTLLWCSPKSGATGIWLYQGDGSTRAWNDLSPFAIETVTQKLPKRLSAINRDTILSHYSPNVCVIEVELFKRASDGEPTHFVTTAESDKIRPNPGDIVMVVWKAEQDADGNTAGDDGWGIIAKKFKDSMVHDVELPLRAENPDLVDHMLNHSLWQTRGFVSTEHGINTMLKCDFAATAGDWIVVRRQDGSRFNAHLALNTDGLKSEISLKDNGIFLFLDHVKDRPGVQARTNRHMMVVGYEAFLKNRIYHGLAMRNDNIIASVSNGDFPDWMRILADNVDHNGEADPVLADNHKMTTVNTYQKRIRDIVNLIGDATYSRKVMMDIQSQYLDRSKAKGSKKTGIRRDTYHYPVVASDNYRSLKPLRVALLTGHLPYDFELADGEWINTKVGFITTTKTWCYMMIRLVFGDGDDHGTALHGWASKEDKFYVTQEAKDAGVPDLVVEPNDVITVGFRWPTGVSCNDKGEWGVEYFVLKPHFSERIGLAVRYPELGEDVIYRFDLENRPTRIDEVVFPDKNSPATFKPQGQTFRRKGVVATTYGIDTFVWQLQSAIEVAAFGGIGAISNVDMFAYQHGLKLPWFCHTETKVDLCTQSIPSASDIAQLQGYIATGVDMIATMDGQFVDAIALERFKKQLGKNHKLFREANPGMLFGFLESAFLAFRREFTDRYSVLLNQQTASMLRLLDDVEVIQNGKPTLVRVFNDARDMVTRDWRREHGSKEMPTDQFDLMADMVIMAMDDNNVSQERREADMLEALAYYYRNGMINSWDQNLMNGGLLVLLGQVLAKLRAKNHNAHLAEEHQTLIRCRAVDHDHLEHHAEGCFIERLEGPEVTELYRTVGGEMSMRCAIAVHNANQAAAAAQAQAEVEAADQQ